MKDVQKILIGPNTSVIDAMQIIDRGSVQIVLIVDERCRIIGTH